MSICHADSASYFITTAIPYVNAAPHVGFALELLQADVLARHHRISGRDVRFLSGTDDNSLKNARAAHQAGVPVEELVACNAAEFRLLRDVLSLSYDDFISTSSDERHAPGVRRLWRECLERGDLYKAPYSGLYCVGCEQYYRRDDLADGVCPEHLTRPEVVEEENYFFRLSKYADRLLERIASGELRIEPASYRTETIRFIERGLEDISVSRSRKSALNWGIPVPDDPRHIIYVWFDALANYITALGYAEEGQSFRRYWLDNRCRTHLVGKGITRFHAIYWPAILLSAGLPLPTTILVHGYLTVDGRKIGKSLGNAVAPRELVERFGVDAVRHYLLHHVRSTQDGDFSVQRLVQAHNSELADKLGNLLRRTTGLVERYADGLVPVPGKLEPVDERLIEAASNTPAAVDSALRDFRIHDASAAVWRFIREANSYAVDTAPWHLARQDSADSSERLCTVLYNLVESLRIIASNLAAFLPDASASLARALDANRFDRRPEWGATRSGASLRSGPILFPKIDLEPRGKNGDEGR